jgi:hypothetical protein
MVDACRWFRLALLSLLLSAGVHAAPRIGLVTMEPGEAYWERFGHNAILVAPDDGSEPTLYNYGYFDFDEPNFLLRFAAGDMRYRLVALPVSEDLAYYADVGRGVDLLWLDVEPDAADRLAEFLAWNARPDNAYYRYDYFTDNCSTRVRDALDAALGGALRKQLSGRSHGLSYRSESLRLAAPAQWMALAIHLGAGPFADRNLSRWDESFVPMRLRDNLREMRTTSGSPLVIAEQVLSPARLPPAPDAPPSWRWLFASLGIGLALGLGTLPARMPRTAAALTGVWWALLGTIGVGLTALWAFSTHRAGFGNENLLLFNPLCLVLLPLVPALARRQVTSARAIQLLRLVAIIAALAMFLKFLPFRVQSNGDWIALVLPVQAMLALRLGRMRSQ